MNTLKPNIDNKALIWYFSQI